MSTSVGFTRRGGGTWVLLNCVQFCECRTVTDGPAHALNLRREGWNRVRVVTHVGGKFRHPICPRTQTNEPNRGGVNRMHCVLFMPSWYRHWPVPVLSSFAMRIDDDEDEDEEDQEEEAEEEEEDRETERARGCTRRYAQSAPDNYSRIV